MLDRDMTAIETGLTRPEAPVRGDAPDIPDMFYCMLGAHEAYSASAPVPHCAG